MIADRNTKALIFPGTLEMGYNIEVWKYFPLMSLNIYMWLLTLHNAEFHAHAVTDFVPIDHD